MFEELKRRCTDDWNAYITHEFVRRAGDGSLPKESFQHYLKQDYLYLIHVARIYGLAVYKSGSLEDLMFSKKSLLDITDLELGLHVKFCGRWGISEQELFELDEAAATVAYTRYVADRAFSGNLLDLHAAMAPCIIGYAELGDWLKDNPDTVLEGNPYREWVEMYSGPEYRKVADEYIAYFDRLCEREATPARMDSLAKTFRDATRMEIAFWDMGLNLSM